MKKPSRKDFINIERIPGNTFLRLLCKAAGLKVKPGVTNSGRKYKALKTSIYVLELPFNNYCFHHV